MGRLVESPVTVILILVVILLLFGAPKLPGMARSLGQSMRIFKSEVKEMKRDDEPTVTVNGQPVANGQTVAGATGHTAPAQGTTAPAAPQTAAPQATSPQTVAPQQPVAQDPAVTPQQGAPVQSTPVVDQNQRPTA